MLTSLSVPAVVAVLLLAATTEADIKPYITTEAEFFTECKTCPRSLCTNKEEMWGSGGAFNVSCWTRGTKIMGDNLWLKKTDQACYITQYDVLEYEGDYTTDLAYCGRESEEQHLTIEAAETKYKTECRICPRINCDVVGYISENTDLELTCWVPDGQVIIDDPYWMKTTNNCYVAQKNLYSKPDITYLDNCGPVPLMDIRYHNNENGTSEVNKRELIGRIAEERAADPEPVLELASRNLMYLVNVTVGEEYAPCRSCPHLSCEPEKIYEFDQEIWLQCITLAVNATDEPRFNESSYWAQSTDFCYVQGSDLWQSISGDFYRFPACDLFPADDDKKLV